MKRIIAFPVPSEARLIGYLAKFWHKRHEVAYRNLIQLYINTIRYIRNDKRSEFIRYNGCCLTNKNNKRVYKMAA